jgi:hypothetical protein
MEPTDEQHLEQMSKKSASETLAMIRHVRGRKRELYRKSPNSPRPRKAGQVKSKVKSMLIIFFDIKSRQTD